MGIDDAEGLIFPFQIFDKARQDDVLDDIREISGVIGVTIIHGPLVSCRTVFGKRGDGERRKRFGIPAVTNVTYNLQQPLLTLESSPECLVASF